MPAAPLAEESAQLEAESVVRRAAFALQISKYIRTTVLILLLPAIGLGIAFPHYRQLFILIGIMVFAALTVTVYMFLHGRGLFLPGFYVFLGGLLLAVAVGYWCLPEVRLAATLAYAVLVTLSIFFLGARRNLLMTILMVAVLSIDALLVQQDRVPHLLAMPSAVDAFVTVSFTAVISVLLAIIVRTIVMGQESFYLAAERAGREIERRATAEAEERRLLQATVEHYAAYMDEVGRGWLNGRLTLADDESSPLSLLGHNLNRTVAGLQRMTLQLSDTARDLASATTEILATTAQQATGAGEQSAAIAQAGTTLAEVLAIAEQTAGRAQGVADLSQRTAGVAQTGQQSVAEAITGMGAVQEKVDAIAQHILSLSEQAQSIGQIITTVSELASQSNMLALNAAVEAARAGEAGRGFSVVASEVRALAEQSRAATAQVKEILGEIQRGVNAAVMATEEGIKRASAGTRLAGEAGLAIQDLAGSVQGSVEAAAQIAAAAGQQQAGMQQVTQAMEQIQSVTGQTAASARQTERAAEELNRLASRLNELVKQYRL